MRFVDVKLSCGWPGCETVGREGEDDVVVRTITMDGTRPREIDICKIHNDELEEVLLPLLEDGRIVTADGKIKKTGPGKRRANDTATSTVSASSAAPADGSGAIVCQVPDCIRDGRPVKSNTGLAQHLIKTHGYTNLAAYYEEYPPSPTN